MCGLIPGWPRVSATYIVINGVQDTGSSVNEGLFAPCLYPHGTKHAWGLAVGDSWRSDRLIPLPAPPSVCPRGWRDLSTAPEKAAPWMVLSLEQQRLIKVLSSLPPPHQPPGYNLCTHNSLLSLPPGNSGTSGEAKSLTETLWRREEVCTHPVIHSFAHPFHSGSRRPQPGTGHTEVEPQPLP